MVSSGINDVVITLGMSYTTVSNHSNSCFHTFFSLATLHPNFFHKCFWFTSLHLFYTGTIEEKISSSSRLWVLLNLTALHRSNINLWIGSDQDLCIPITGTILSIFTVTIVLW